MNINFKYSKKIDKKCWQRYEIFLAKNGDVWGISRKINPIISIRKVDLSMDVSVIVKKYEELFGISVNIYGYVITTPFSMINDDGKISKEGVVYYSIYTANPSVVMAHEIFHIYFEKYTRRNIPNYEEAKEYFTVILNDIFSPGVSIGYPAHKKMRQRILKTWIKTHSIDACVKVL